MSLDYTKPVTLRTGESVPRSTVETIYMLLQRIYSNPRLPMAFYELVTTCRDASHVPFGNAAQVLKDQGFVDDIDPSSGCVNIHADIRKVVLAASEGSGAAIRLVSPYAD